jgi:hypothetical protein
MLEKRVRGVMGQARKKRMCGKSARWPSGAAIRHLPALTLFHLTQPKS